MRMVFRSNQPWNLIERKNSQKDRNYRDDEDWFPTKKKKKSRVSNHILQQSRIYFIKAELENQIRVVKSVEKGAICLAEVSNKSS